LSSTVNDSDYLVEISPVVIVKVKKLSAILLAESHDLAGDLFTAE
jgi:hypothetical protein